MQRLRLKFYRGDELKFISHLDIMRLWERAIRRASVPILYSEGFSPHPRISLAAPLSVGMTSSAELMDIFISGQGAPKYTMSMVNNQLPDGIKILDAWPVGLETPALQASVRYAEYEVHGVITDNRTEQDIAIAIQKILESTEIQWQHMREKAVRKYDLRALIQSLQISGFLHSYAAITMRLRCDTSGSGRPDQVMKALGFAELPQKIHRTALILN